MFLVMWQFKFGISEAAVVAIILFLYTLFNLLGKKIQNREMNQAACTVWVSKLIGFNKLPIRKYIACSKCHSLYEYNWCIGKRDNDQLYSKACEFVRYPNHPHQTKRTLVERCWWKLFEQITIRLLKPRKLYCYKSIVNSVQQLVCRPNFLQKSEL